MKRAAHSGSHQTKSRLARFAEALEIWPQ